MEPTTQYTFLKMISDGGWMMIPLLTCSLVSVAVIIERLFWGPRLSRTMPELLRKEVEKLIQQKKFDEVLGLCRASNTALARIAVTILKKSHRPRQELIEAVELTGRREVQTLQKGLSVLSTIAAISPLLGLLGTVSGMIQNFSVVAVHGVGDANLLSAGISEALVSTASGLTVALPTLVFYRYFLHQTQQLAMIMEEYALNLVDTIHSGQDEPKQMVVGE